MTDSGSKKAIKCFEIGEIVEYKGDPVEIISFIPTSGKYLLRGIALPVTPQELKSLKKGN